jgi:hypothetical protein
MPTSFYPSNLQWVGIAKETTYGTAIAAPTIWIPVDAPKYKENITALKDKALRGSMSETYAQQQGMKFDELGYKTYFYLDSVYPHFLALLGNPDTITGSSDPYTHKTAVYNGSGTNAAQPPSYTLFWADAAGKAYQIPGAIVSSVKVSLAPDGLTSMDVSWTGLPATVITPPTNTPTTNKPMPAWNSTITFNSVVSSAYSAIDLEFKRAIEIIPTITGTQAPFAVFGGPVSVTGSLTAVYQNSTDANYAAFQSNTQPTLLVKVAPPGDSTHYIQFQASDVAFDSAEISGTNKWQEIKGNIECIANSTDALSGGFSPVLVTFLTAQSAAF